MKKNIIIVLVCTVLLVSICVFYFLNNKKGFDDRKQPLVFGETTSIDDLKSGDIVSIFIDSETNSATRIMICDDLESCNAMPSRPNNKDQDIKDNNIKQPLNITGTIQSLENNIINLELESEEIETINLSDDIQIFKRQFDKPMKD